MKLQLNYFSILVKSFLVYHVMLGKRARNYTTQETAPTNPVRAIKQDDYVVSWYLFVLTNALDEPT